MSSSEDDLFTMIMISPFLLPVATGAALGFWDSGREWALDHHLVVDGAEAIVAIPGWDGAGIGGVHIVVLGALLVVFLVLGSVASRRRENARDRALRKRHMDNPFGS